jgi:lysozyme
MDATSLSILRARLILHEGVRLAAYYDSEGYATQGAGHLLSPVKHVPLAGFPDITTEQAMAWLDADMAEAEDHVGRVFTWFATLDGIRQGALVEMAFQLGLAGLLGFINMISCCRFGNYAKAAAEMLKSDWHKETPARCEALARIMETGKVDDA